MNTMSLFLLATLLTGPTGSVESYSPLNGAMVNNSTSTEFFGEVKSSVGLGAGSHTFKLIVTSTWTRPSFPPSQDLEVAMEWVVGEEEEITKKATGYYNSTSRKGDHTLVVKLIAWPTNGGSESNATQVAIQTTSYTIK